MITRGECTVSNRAYGLLLSHTKECTEAILIENNTVVSAYKVDSTGSYCFNNNKAQEVVKLVQTGLRGCTRKNGQSLPFELGAITEHNFTKSNIEYTIQTFKNEIAGVYIKGKTENSNTVETTYIKNLRLPQGINYIKLTEIKKDLELAEDELDTIQVRSVQEIALEKEDITWLNNKKYYIVNDDEVAEKLFTYFDSYNGVIAYDTETTGLKINCFGKIGSKYEAELKKYNEEHPNDRIRADRLVGIIFCIEPNVSYYFPCYNRKFKNLYEDKNSPIRKKILQNIRARYTLSSLSHQPLDEMRQYILNTPDNEIRTDVILMERVRHIIETKHLVAHNGSFEWKVGWQYEIDTNIKDDTMIMHQLMYKFRSTTRNSGEPSNLKYLAKVELGVDQWELKDFFPAWKEDKTGTVREKTGKKKGTQIDFSYMDYDGTRVYAPTDGDVTLQLYFKYKEDLVKNHKELEFLYSVELVVACAVGYMEFYGHRLDESKILGAREQTRANMAMLEYEIRKAIKFNSLQEDKIYAEIKELKERINSEKDNKIIDDELLPKMSIACENYKKAIDENTEHQLNLSAPGQVADLFYNKLKYPMQGDKPSVAKKAIKALTKERDDNGNPKYPIACLYSKYKNEDTLMTKFFDNLPYFMYPGGYIFSSYGQIATATGRMSCIEENTIISCVGVGNDKPIKDIKAGDMVYCYDKTGQLRAREVLKVIDKGRKGCIKLTFKIGDIGKETELICTPEHKILTSDRGWIEARDLEQGESVYYLVKSKTCKPYLYDTHGNYETERNFINREIFKISNKQSKNYVESLVSQAQVSGIDIANSISDMDMENVYEHKLVKIEHVGIKHVYDLEVEDYHCFIGNGIVVHNCNKPNAQQYPKVITKIVVPREDYVMVDADYSQIEYRVLTALAKNEGLAELFSDPDSDYHTLMASMMYDVPYASVTPAMRSAAKSFNFGIPYGMGFGSLAILLTGKNTPQTRDEAKEKYEMYFKNQPRTRKFFDDVKEMASVNKYTKTLFNRYRYYSFEDKDGNVNNAKKASALRQAGNAVIQGCLHGDTLIDTLEFGIVHIKDVAGQSLQVWDGDKWSHGDILYSGKKRKCTVKFSNGQTIVCSPIHKFLVISERGTKRFIECQNLLTKGSNKNPHRVVVNTKYEPSEQKYYSECTYKNNSIANNMFMDTEILKGLLREVFDSNGDVSENVIELTFGKQYKFELTCSDIQSALLFFGIRSNYYEYSDSYKLVIKAQDNQKFLDSIGFINKEKQARGMELECIKDEGLFGHSLVVESVEITDEYIDMYDVCNTDGGYYVANGIITHNTAADIFKISVARNFNYIRKNKLLGLLLIINMIHDEQLMEINSKYLNVQRALADIGCNMQYDIAGFPPLYIGAGVGTAWGYAKGKMAEIHPLLLKQLTDEAKSIALFKDNPEANVHEMEKYIAKRVLEFRRDKVKAYITNPDNWNKDIHPAIGGLINLQFNYGRGDDAKAYKGPNGEVYSDSEFLMLNLADFIAENNLDVDINCFKPTEVTQEAEEEDSEYSDNDEDDIDIDEISYTEDVGIFSKIDESDKLYGIDIRDIIDVFGCCILEAQKICGIDMRNLYYKKKDAIIAYIADHQCDDDDENGLEVVMLLDGNVCKYTGVYISNITSSDIEREYKKILHKDKYESLVDYKAGDIHNRSQA